MLECVEDKGIDSQGYLKIREYFKEIGMESAFDYFYEHNDGRNNPYHNNTHTFNVVELIKQYCDSEKLSKNMRKSLLIAALFHDFNHSGGKFDDDANIKIALKGLIKMFDETRLWGRGNIFILPTFNRVIINTMIHFTRYPYKDSHYDKNKKITVFVRALREADILSYEHDKWEKYVYNGLCKELGSDKTKRSENLKRMLDFHKKLLDDEIKIDFFKKLKDEHYPSFEKDVNDEINKSKN